MVAEWLVCANCAGRVSDGRCAVCRAQLTRLREQQRTPWALLTSPPALLALFVALVAVLALVATQPA